MSDVVGTREPGVVDGELARPRRPWTMLALAGLGAVALFLVVHVALTQVQDRLLFDFIRHRYGVPAADGMSMGSAWSEVVSFSGGFVGAGVASVVLVLAGHRRTWWVPAALLFAGLFVQPSWLRWAPASLAPGFAPAPWVSPAAPLRGMLAWGGALFDFGLLLAPAAVALRQGMGPGDRESPRRPSVAAVAAVILLAGFGVWLWVSTREAITPSSGVGVPFLPLAQATPLVPLLAFGALLGIRRLRWAWALVLVPVLVAIDGASPSGLGGWAGALSATGPFVAATVAASAWEPAARGVEWLRDQVLVAVVTLNVLNVADAILTQAAVGTAQAVESNPVVRAIGLPTKIVLVAALSLVLYRTRPRVLVWPLLAFVAVIAWQAAGWYLNAHV